MTERFNPIAPRLRSGEVMPEISEGMVPTRHYGKIIGVPIREEGEPMYGDSLYTVRQVQKLEQRRAELAVQASMQALLEYENANVESQVIFSETSKENA